MTSEAPERIWASSGRYYDYVTDWSEGEWDIGSEFGEEYIRTDLHQQALDAAREEGRRQGLEEAAKVAQRHEDHEGLDQDGNPYVSEEAHLFGSSVAYEIKQEIRALINTPADPVAEAAKVLMNAPELMEGWSDDGWRDICALAQKEGE